VIEGNSAMIIKCLPTSIPVVILLWVARAAGGDDIRSQIEALGKEIQTEELKGQITEHATRLKDGDLREKRRAILFFRDIRAKKILLGILTSGSLQEKTAVVECGLDLFEAKDIRDLYKATLSFTAASAMGGGENISVMENLLRRTCARAAEILGVRPPALNGSGPREVRAWWLLTLRTAKSGPNSFVNELDNTLKHIQLEQDKTK
jgi:hypothetical protein